MSPGVHSRCQRLEGDERDKTACGTRARLRRRQLICGDNGVRVKRRRAQQRRRRRQRCLPESSEVSAAPKTTIAATKASKCRSVLLLV